MVQRFEDNLFPGICFFLRHAHLASSTRRISSEPLLDRKMHSCRYLRPPFPMSLVSVIFSMSHFVWWVYYASPFVDCFSLDGLYRRSMQYTYGCICSVCKSGWQFITFLGTETSNSNTHRRPGKIRHVALQLWIGASGWAVRHFWVRRSARSVESRAWISVLAWDRWRLQRRFHFLEMPSPLCKSTKFLQSKSPDDLILLPVVIHLTIPLVLKVTCFYIQNGHHR